MYDIALSVGACVRSGTRADVAWMIAPRASDEALAFTPGGGRIGGLCHGAFDGLLADVAGRQLATGRMVRHTLNAWEADVSGLPEGTVAEFLVVPAAQLPPDIWPRLLARHTVGLTATLDSDGVVVSVADAATSNDDAAREMVSRSTCDVQRQGNTVTTVFAPVTRLVVAGGGPMGEAIAAQGRLLGWKVTLETRPDQVMGLTATLSPLDAVVILGHDVEASSRCLMFALDSEAGYIGALGSKTMQQNRADWLAYRDVTDLSRVRGPARLDIGARTPAEIAVSVVAQAISQLSQEADHN